MSFTSQSHKLITAAVAFMLLAVPGLTAVAEVASPPVLTLRISDTTAMEGADDAWFSVYFQNRTDTVAAFTMMVLLNRIDMVEFKVDAVDTTIDTTWEYCAEWVSGECTEWVDTMIVDTVLLSSALDTAGCMISGWQYVTAMPVLGSKYGIKISAMADKMGPPSHPGLPPQTGEGLLYRLRVRVYDSLDEGYDSIPLPDSVHLRIVDDCRETGFSDASGDHLIGTITEHSICDTTFLKCLEWSGEECQVWDTVDSIHLADSLVIDTFWVYWYCIERDGNDSCIHWIDTTQQDAESIWIYQSPYTVRDTTVSFYHDGKLLVEPEVFCICGDANDDKSINVGDVVYLMNYIFKPGMCATNPPVGCPPTYMECADMNHRDGMVNIGDVVYLMTYIFKNGTDPDCEGQ